MSVKVIVDREYLSNQIEDVLEVIYFVEQGYSYNMDEDKIVLYYEDKMNKKEIPLIDYDAVQAKYPDVKIEADTQGGVTFFYAGGCLVDCGIMKTTSDAVEDTVIGVTNSDVTRGLVEIVDELVGKTICGPFWAIAKFL